MSGFIISEAVDKDADMIKSDNENEENIMDEESNNLIDDETEFSDQEPSNYRGGLANVTSPYEESLAIYMADYADDDECSDPANFVFGDDSPPPDFCEFKSWEKRLEKFNDTLKQLCVNSADIFYNAVIWGTYFKLKGKTANFDSDLEDGLVTLFIQRFEDLKSQLKLDINLDTFEKNAT